MKKGDEAVLKLANKRIRIAEDATSESREFELDDLKFLAGSPDNQWQWPDDILNTRNSKNSGLSSRPCLTINKLPQHVRQVTNDQKENRPSGRVIGVNDEADSDLAKILTGMVRHIEYISDADVAYDTACDAQVTTGEGYFRILTDYVDDDSFDQEIKIGRIRNQFSVHMDPTIQDPCGIDSEWCFISEEILKEEFEDLYPDATPISTILQAGIGDDSIGSWINEETIKIAEYFYASYEEVDLHLFQNGEIAEEGSFIADELIKAGNEPVKTRTVRKRTINWCKINGYEILEESVWPGKWIPVIRVIGNEWEIEGKLHISGLVRNAKDPQRMYNYWTSQEAEMLALAPKAPFIGYAGQFEGFEQQWKTANTIPWPYLEVNPDIFDGTGAPLPLPQRSQPPMQQTGLISAKMGASDDIKSTTGQYDSSLGQTSNERSGKAIMARERQGDTGTYHYVDNLARAVRYGVRQIVDLIPKIYDTARIARIMGEDGKADSVKINPEQQQAKIDVIDENTGAVIESIYNPGVGKYDVVITTGPGYTTKRQEAADMMGQLLQGNKELWGIAGDLFVKNLDWPGADEMAERLKRSIPKELLDENASPELLQAQQQIEQMGQQMEQMAMMLKNMQTSFEQQEIDVKKFEAETKRIAAMADDLKPEQIQDIVLGTLHGMMDSGDLQSPKGLQNNNPPEQNNTNTGV